jgi:hypothetical protein
MTYQEAQRLAAIFNLDMGTTGVMREHVIPRLEKDLVTMRPHYDEIRDTCPALLGELYYDSCRVEIAKARLLAAGAPYGEEGGRLKRQMEMQGV